MEVEHSSQHEERLVKENLGLVVHVAKSFHPPNHTELDEYIQSGRIGLLKAIRKHNELISTLSTYAWRYIGWEILNYIRQNKRHNYDTIDDIEDHYNNDHLWEFLPDNLNSQELSILQLRYDGCTFKEIGRQNNTTSYWASKIYKSAIKKITRANNDRT